MGSSGLFSISIGRGASYTSSGAYSITIGWEALLIYPSDTFLFEMKNADCWELHSDVLLVSKIMSVEFLAISYETCSVILCWLTGADLRLGQCFSASLAFVMTLFLRLAYAHLALSVQKDPLLVTMYVLKMLPLNIVLLLISFMVCYDNIATSSIQFTYTIRIAALVEIQLRQNKYSLFALSVSLASVSHFSIKLYRQYDPFRNFIFWSVLVLLMKSANLDLLFLLQQRLRRVYLG